MMASYLCSSAPQSVCCTDRVCLPSLTLCCRCSRIMGKRWKAGWFAFHLCNSQGKRLPSRRVNNPKNSGTKKDPGTQHAFRNRITRAPECTAHTISAPPYVACTAVSVCICVDGCVLMSRLFVIPKTLSKTTGQGPSTNVAILTFPLFIFKS